MADRSMLLSLLPLRQCDYDLMPGMPPKPDLLADVHLDSITTNQAAIAALFRVVNRYVGNLAPMPGVFPDYPEPVVRNTNSGTELAMMRWGMPPPPRTGGPRSRIFETRRRGRRHPSANSPGRHLGSRDRQCGRTHRVRCTSPGLWS
jgi:hypothetical protein